MTALPYRKSNGFTLIELLIVIAIIGILMALLFPAVTGVIEAARKAKAKNDVVQLAIAVKGYETEYGKLPTSVVSPDDGAEASQGWFQGPNTGGQYNNEIVKVLMGEDYNGLNPRKIVFLEGRPAKGATNKPKDGIAADGMFYDPWGTPYAIKMDTSYNNALEYYDTNQKNNFRTSVITISFGPNMIQQDTSKTVDSSGKKVDDIVSFQ